MGELGWLVKEQSLGG